MKPSYELFKLPSGKYVQVLNYTNDRLNVREWDFDEQYNAVPTAKTYSIPMEEVPMLLNVKCPCTKTCPRRTAGCAITCPDWKDYSEKRQKVYDKRKENALIKNHNGMYEAYDGYSGKVLITDDLSVAVKHAYGIEEEV